MPLPQLSPGAQAAAEELVACAPPLAPWQKRLIQQVLGPVLRELAAAEPVAEPIGA